MLFKVREKISGKVYPVYSVHYEKGELKDYSEFLIYDREEETFRWEFAEHYEPVDKIF